MARAGLLAPAAQAEAAQFAPCGGAEVGLLGAVEPFAVAVGGGLVTDTWRGDFRLFLCVAAGVACVVGDVGSGGGVDGCSMK